MSRTPKNPLNPPVTLPDEGHKLLHIADFGGWYCAHCKNGTDETGPWPNEVPCTEDQNNPLYKG